MTANWSYCFSNDILFLVLIIVLNKDWLSAKNGTPEFSSKHCLVVITCAKIWV